MKRRQFPALRRVEELSLAQNLWRNPRRYLLDPLIDTIDWLIDWLFYWLIDWLFCWLIDWLMGWLIFFAGNPRCSGSRTVRPPHLFPDYSIEDLVTQDIDLPKPASPVLEKPVFKRPMSPSNVSAAVALDETTASTAPTTTSVSRADDTAHAPFPALRARKDVRVAPQKCFLSQQKRKRPETDTGLLASILGALHGPMGKLLIPDAVLMDYLDEAGVDVADVKVPRLMGVVAEHHSANIIQVCPMHRAWLISKTFEDNLFDMGQEAHKNGQKEKRKTVRKKFELVKSRVNFSQRNSQALFAFFLPFFVFRTFCKFISTAMKEDGPEKTRTVEEADLDPKEKINPRGKWCDQLQVILVSRLKFPLIDWLIA